METKDIVIIVLLFGSFFALLAAATLRDVFKKRREKREKQEYREKYVQQITLRDARFGEITAEYDTLKKTLLADNAEFPRFGSRAPTVLSAEDYTPEQDAAVLRTIGIAYDRAREILEGLAGEIVREQQLHEDEEPDDIAELVQQIKVTEFEFVFDDEAPAMQILAGAELDHITYGLNALYHIDSGAWEYDAERIGA